MLDKGSRLGEEVGSRLNPLLDNDKVVGSHENAGEQFVDMDKKIGMKAIEVASEIIGDALERKAEKPVMNFSDYTELCNRNNDGSRARGVLSEECYQYIINDQSTDFIHTNNQRIPVLIDAQYGIGMGYDEPKCREYAGNQSGVKILALPVHELDAKSKNQLGQIFSSYDKLALYFGDHNNDESNCLNEILSYTDIAHSEIALIDDRVRRAEDGQASLYLYSCRVEQATRDSGIRFTVNDIKKYYDEQTAGGDEHSEHYIGPVFSTYAKKNEKTGELAMAETKTILEMGNEVSPQKAQKIWDMYNSIFDELGKGKHPISMQDGIDEFMGLLKSENTMLAVTYGKGETNDFDDPICFTYFVDDISKLYWLNEDYLQKKSNNKNTFLFTPGIVSSAVGASLSHLPIELFVRAGCETGMSACIFFENTNFSKEYIPLLVNRYASRVCEKSNREMIFTKSELLDQVFYRLWSIGSEEK